MTRWPPATSTTTASPTWPSAPAGESVGSITGAGAVNVLYGGAGGLTGTGSQLFTQNSSGVGSIAEEATPSVAR